MKVETVGIVRRIDDLGRIVIPKEIRQRIFGKNNAEGEPMEIFVDGDLIILKRYIETSPETEKEIRNKAIDECAEKMRQMCKGIPMAEIAIDAVVKELKGE